MSGRRSRWLSIQATLILCFVLVAGLGIGTVSAARYWWLTSSLRQEQLEDDVLLARAASAGLEHIMRARIQLITTLAEDLGVEARRDPGTIQKEIDATNRREAGFRNLAVMDTEGVARVFSPSVNDQGQPNAGQRYGDRAWFQAALRSPAQPVYDVVIGRVVKQPTVSVAAPIRSANGTVLGVVAGALDLAELRESIRFFDPGWTDRIVVVDSRGRVIGHSSPALESEARDLSAEPVFQAAQHQSQGTIEYWSTLSGTRRLAAYVRIPSTGWVVWASRGPEFLATKIQQLLWDTILVSVGGILIAVAGAVLVSGALTRPLRILTDATRDLAARRFAVSEILATRTSPITEFDELLHGFGQMADMLRTQYDDLEAKVAERTQTLAAREREARDTAALLTVQEAIQRGYGELAALLNSLDRSHILEQGTKKIAASLHAPLAAVYLTDNGPTTLRLKTYAALDAGGLDTAVLAPTGLPAEVVRRGAPVILSRADGAEALHVDTGVGRIPVAAVAGWPLMSQSRVVGVVVVATLEPLAEHGRSFLDNAARQLSVALSNAALYESIRFQSQELERLNGELRRASGIKSQFLASMSHELRTPLNSIIGFTDLLLTSARDPLSERQRIALQRVRQSGQHLLALINDVLDLSKIEAGRAEWRPAPFPLASLVQECLDTLELVAQAKGLTLRATGLEAAPTLVQDRGRVKQIILNLLSNAVKFTATGSVEVRAEPTRMGMATVAVTDTGMGIAPEHLETIFDQFQRVDSPETRAAGGTGLGLAISRRLATLAGGTLTVESAVGEGSVFTLQLPLRYAGPTPPEEPGSESEDTSPTGTPRVLVIDDDRNAVELIREAMVGDPVRVEWAANPVAGMARVRARRPALILVDVMLQGEADGWDVLDALKSDPETRDIPVVVHSVIDNRRRAEQLGANDVLVKPAAAAAVRAVLTLALQRAGVG